MHAGASTALASALGMLSLEPGKDFEIVMVSFDPRDTPALAAAKKADVPRSATSAPAPTTAGIS